MSFFPSIWTQGPALRSVITALNILEKYGKNLLSPNRPKFWRSVKFNNPVFKTTVDAVEVIFNVLNTFSNFIPFWKVYFGPVCLSCTFLSLLMFVNSFI